MLSDQVLLPIFDFRSHSRGFIFKRSTAGFHLAGRKRASSLRRLCSGEQKLLQLNTDEASLQTNHWVFRHTFTILSENQQKVQRDVCGESRERRTSAQDS